MTGAIKNQITSGRRGGDFLFAIWNLYSAGYVVIVLKALLPKSHGTVFIGFTLIGEV